MRTHNHIVPETNYQIIMRVIFMKLVTKGSIYGVENSVFVVSNSMNEEFDNAVDVIF